MRTLITAMACILIVAAIAWARFSTREEQALKAIVDTTDGRAEVELLKTDGASGTAPVSDGANGLTMTDILTETDLDTEAELESQLTDVSNVYTNNDGDPIFETELDTEAELEAQLTDVTNVLTENDIAAGDKVIGTNAGGTAFEEKTITAVASETDVTHGVGTITIGIVDPLAAGKGGTGIDSSAATGTCRADSGTWTCGDLKLESYATASLPACSENELAIVSDGDAAGSIVKCDSGGTWRCIQEEKGELNIGCPPYNALSTNGDNSTEIQAAIDRMEALVSSGIRACVIVPGKGYAVTSALTNDTGSSTLLGCFKGAVPGASSITFNFAGATGLCVNCTTGASTDGNEFYWHGVRMKGTPGTGPDELLRLTRVFQWTFKDFEISIPHKDGIRFSTSGLAHGVVDNALLIESTAAQSGSAFLWASAPLSDVKIINLTGEGSIATSVMSILRLSASVESSGLTLANWDWTNAEIFELITTDGNHKISGSSIYNLHGLRVRNRCLDLRFASLNTLPTNISDVYCKASSEATATHDYGAYLSNFTGRLGNSHFEDFTNGIRLDNPEDAWVSGNRIRGSTDGIEFNNADRLKIVDNDIEASDECVEGIGTSEDGNLIAGTTFHGACGTTYFDLAAGFSGGNDVLVLADQVQAETCPGGGLTLTPHYKNIELNVTGSPCAVTMAERPGKGQQVRIAVDQVSGTTANFSDTANVSEIAGAFSMGLWDSLVLRYVDDRWIEQGRSDN